jgi:PAS domain S-box-containing protein
MLASLRRRRRGAAGSSRPSPFDPTAASLLAALPDGLIVVDASGEVVMHNDAAASLLDLDVEVSRDRWSLHHGVYLPDQVTRCPADALPLARAARGETVDGWEVYLRNARVPEGAWLSLTIRPLRDADGAPRGGAVIMRDVSGSRTIGRALQEQCHRLDHQFRRQAALAAIDLNLSDPDALPRLVRRATELVRHHLPAEHVLLHELPEAGAPAASDAFPEFPAGRLGAAARWIVANGRPLAVPHADDDPFSDAGPSEALAGAGSYAGVPVAAEGGPLGVLLAVRNRPRAFSQDDLDFMSALANRVGAAITAMRLCTQLRTLNRTLREQLDTVPVMIWMAGPDKRSIYFNKTWQDFTGRPAAHDVGGGWSDVGIHPEDRARAWDRFERGFDARQPFRVEYRLRRSDGVYRWVMDSGVPWYGADGSFLGYIGCGADVTDHREAESELARHRSHLESLVEARTRELEDSHARLRVSERLAALGTLTAGLGHDIDNVLFPIRWRLDAMDPTLVPQQHRELCHAVSNAVEYLQQLSDGLRLFALDPDDAEASCGPTDVAEWWAQVGSLICHSIPASVSERVDIPAGLPRIGVAPHRLTQAVLNLIVNACEAMPEGGHLEVEARPVEDGAVELSVRDTGTGVDEEVQRRAFEPFFTTKRRGLSTGLGLSLVHGVVAAARGTVRLDPRPGGGAIAAMRFPRAASDPCGGPGGATVSLRDSRRAAWWSGLLRSQGYDVVRGDGRPPGPAGLWVVEPTPESRRLACEFLAADPGNRVIVSGRADPDWEGVAAVVVDDHDDLEAIREAVAGLRRTGR